MLKFLEENFAVLAAGGFALLSNGGTWFVATRATNRQRRDNLEAKYTELLNKYVDLSEKYLSIIDKNAEIEITIHKLNQTVETLTLKQCTQCQHP